MQTFFNGKIALIFYIIFLKCIFVLPLFDSDGVHG